MNNLDLELQRIKLEKRVQTLDNVGNTIKLKSFCCIGVGIISQAAGLYAMNEFLSNRHEHFAPIMVALIGMGAAYLYQGVKGIEKNTRVEINKEEVLSKIGLFRKYTNTVNNNVDTNPIITKF